MAELAFAARRAELRTVAARPRGRAWRARARELLALQSSDWAFMGTRALAGDYPDRRAAAHAADLDAALGGSGRLRARACATSRPTSTSPR